MTSKEALMYKILGRITTAELPIVFKGALITKLVLAEQGFDLIERETKDMDMNWVGGDIPSEDELRVFVDNALADVCEGFTSSVTRKYVLGQQAAGITIYDENGDKAFSMDIDINKVTGYRYYNYEISKIRGVLPTEIFADKIAAISGDKVFRRAKDIVDVYALSSCVSVTTDEIYNTSAQTGNEIKAFDGFLNRKDDLQHAYDKLRGVEGKPPFDTVYARLKTFLMPFIERDRTARVWQAEMAEWAYR
jgi:hypothetical protein